MTTLVGIIIAYSNTNNIVAYVVMIEFSDVLNRYRVTRSPLLSVS